MNATVNTANPFLSLTRQGIYFGVAFGLIGAALDVLYVFTYSPLIILLIALAIIIGGCIAYGGAGLRAARQTGSAMAGAGAGLLAGMLSFLIGYVVNLILAYNATDTMRRNGQAGVNMLMNPFRNLVMTNITIHYTNQYVIQNATNSIGAIFIVGIIGAVLGVIGGLWGRRKAAR